MMENKDQNSKQYVSCDTVTHIAQFTVTETCKHMYESSIAGGTDFYHLTEDRWFEYVNSPSPEEQIQFNCCI